MLRLLLGREIINRWLISTLVVLHVGSNSNLDFIQNTSNINVKLRN